MYGVPRVHQGADPSLGNEAIITVPPGTVWRLSSFAVVLAETGGVNPITPALQVKEAAGGVVLWEVDGFQVTASASGVRVHAGAGVDRQEVAADDLQLLPLPSGLVLPPEARIETVTQGSGTANYGAPVAVAEARPDPEA